MDKTNVLLQALLGVLSPEQKADLTIALLEGEKGASVATKDTSVVSGAKVVSPKVDNVVVAPKSGLISGAVVVAPSVANDNEVDKVEKKAKGKTMVAYRLQLRDTSETARKPRKAGDVEYLTERQVQMTINSYTKNDSEKASAIMGIMGGTLPEYTNAMFVIRPLPEHVNEQVIKDNPADYPTTAPIVNA